MATQSISVSKNCHFYRLRAPYSLITTLQIFGFWWLSELWIVIVNNISSMENCGYNNRAIGKF